ncbi:tetratricopeptide repeat protein [Mangrovibacter yixingensis]|uniref:tetratricopeptide repeat protein n=1 Tax=Mangrovibacter yixingensis TaxID=1529639 RepID=UPI001CF9C571|nr:tetratricopeptide repeat protein [Mangrovibacter yixingensis]
MKLRLLALIMGVAVSGQVLAATALEKLQQQAEQGDAEAQCQLGLAYAKGEVGKPDMKQAETLLQKAVDQKATCGYLILGAFYGEVQHDYKKSRPLLEKAAAQNSAPAMIELGNLYEYGQGVDKDYKTSTQWYAKAAKLGSEDGKYKLALSYYYGKGVAKDEKKANQMMDGLCKKGADRACEFMKD